MDNESNKQKKIKKIVIVEDNDNVAKLIAKALTNKSTETKVIPFGSAATFYAMENDDCLLLMEYQLPDMTAKEVISNLQSSNRNTPFIIMSPPGNEKAVIEMMKMGARDFLIKEQGFLELLPPSVTRVIQQLETENLLAVAEQNLQFSENRFGNIFNSITDAILIYDFQGKILTVNDAACKLLGFSDKELSDMTIFELQPEEFAKNYSVYLAELRALKRIRYETDLTDNTGQSIAVECISRVMDYDDSQAILTIAHDISERKNAENHLRQREERLQRIADAMTDYIYTVYVDQGKPHKTVHSAACKTVTGYTPEEFTANPFLWIEMVDQQDKDFVLKNIQRILKGEQIKPYEHRIVKKNGETAWLRNTPVLHFDSQKNLVSYDGVIQDITEKKKTEIEHIERQAQLAAIVEAFDGLIYVCSPDYRIEYMNDKFITRTGYDPVGDLCYKALHNLEEICSWCVFDRVSKGETVKWEIQSPKDNRWYSIVNTPIYHHDGRISKQSLIIDISDLKFAKQEVSRLNNLYFNLLEELTYPVCRFQPDGKIISANRAFVDTFFEGNDAAITEQSLFTSVPGELGVWTEKILPALNAKQVTMKMSVKQVKGNGMTLKDKTWAVMAILDSENNIMEYQAILKDHRSKSDEKDFVLHSS